MKALENKIYVQIINDKCHWIFTISELPEWCEDDINVIDITDIPDVEVGCPYVDGVFLKRDSLLKENLKNRALETRLRFLASSDWTQLPDIAQNIKDKWVPYRQALRDITIQPGFPDEITWPTQPV